MKHQSLSTQWRQVFGSLLVAGSMTCLQAQPIIVNVVETGGDNEATDTIVAQWSGVTWNATIAGEPIAGIAVGTPYTVPLFGEDVPTFVDRNHQYNGATAALPIPDYLLGGEYIMSGNDNRDNASYQLAITVSDAAIVYMLFDNRIPDGVNTTPPNAAWGIDPTTWGAELAWVGTEGFQPVMTGYNRNSDPSVPDELGIDEGGDGTGPGNGINQYYSIYSKLIPAAGTFTIYQADAAGRNMYGVVIKRAPNSVNNPPEIKNVSPANNTLFHPPGSGLNFAVSTISPNSIAAGNVKLFLNGSDVSSALTVGGSATSRTASYAALQPNTAYLARIVASDQAGRSSTNTFSFDTFSATTAIAIEAEDYNYDSGKFLNPATTGGYLGFSGTRDVDYHNNLRNASATLYRTGDGIAEAVTGDVARPAFTSTGATDYQLTTVLAGDWWNYTRAVPDGNYRVYLRAASPAVQSLRLDRVSGATTASQTTSALGTFFVGPGTAAFGYAPLVDVAGNPVTVNLTGNTTLRLTALQAAVNLQLNYLLLVPATGTATPAYVASASPIPGATGVSPDAVVRIALANGSSAVTESSIAVTHNGNDVTANAVKTPTSNGFDVSYDPPGLLGMGAAQNVRVVFSDAAGARYTNEWIFTTVGSLVTIPSNYATPPGSGQGSGFNYKIRKAPNYNMSGATFTLANTTARANQQLADLLIDPDTQEPYVNEAAGPNNTGTGTTTTVNFDQAAANIGFFGGDQPFPYIDIGFTPDPNNIAMEFTTYAELTAGVHRFGVRSDDGFQLSAGPTFAPADASLVLGQYEGGRGEGLPGGETVFDFQVETSGVYALRMIWYEGNGGANVELYSINRDTGVRTLLNDSAAGAVKTFTSRTTQIFTPTVSITNPVNGANYPTVTTNLTITANASVTGGQITKVEFFDRNTNKIGEATSAPFSMTWNNLGGGSYTVWAIATDNKGLSSISSKINFQVALLVQVNFQNTTVMEPPAGYLPDYGYAYTDEAYLSEWGYRYGWDFDNTAHARNRNNAASPDERYDTFNHMQKPEPAGTMWEIEIPNGRYSVYGVAGESDNNDSVYDVLVEGVTLVKGTPTSAMRWHEGTTAVNLTDGRLTLSNGPTASNNKIAFVEVYKLPAEVPRPVLNPPVRAGDNIILTWSGGRLQEAAELNGPWTDVTGTSPLTVPATAPRKFYRAVGQ